MARLALRASTTVFCFRNVSRDEAVNYVLSLIYLLLKEDSQIAEKFHGPSISDPYTPFLRLLQRQNSFAQELAALALASIVAARPNKSIAGTAGEEEEDSFGVSTSSGGSSSDAIVQIILSFIDWICGQLRKPSDQPPESVVHALAMLLYERGIRPAVVRGKCSHTRPQSARTSIGPVPMDVLECGLRRRKRLTAVLHPCVRPPPPSPSTAAHR